MVSSKPTGYKSSGYLTLAEIEKSTCSYNKEKRTHVITTGAFSSDFYFLLKGLQQGQEGAKVLQITV